MADDEQQQHQDVPEHENDIQDNHQLPPQQLPTTVTAVNIKIPPFWPADPEVSFAQIDAQLTL